MIQRLGHNKLRVADKYLLLTGATGFVGRYLMRDLLLTGHRVAVVIRPDRKSTAPQRIEAIMQHWEREAGRILPRPIVLSGDIREKRIGLSNEDFAWVQNSCDRIVHSAAVLHFFGDRQSEPWLTNVDGTKNIVSLCEHFAVRQFHYLSTAYACGQRTDRVLENELDKGQSFRNDYEHSKFVAESYVRDHCAAGSVTVYRPSVVVGDSQTGATTSYHGLFLYLRLLAMLVPQQQRNARGAIYTPIQLPLQGDEPRNLVPVDWVSQVICGIIGNRAAHGQTFHLTPDVRTTPRLVVDSCYEYFNSCGVEYAGPQSHADGHESEFAKSFFENTKIYHDYDRSDPDFDRANLKKFTGHLPCPAIDKAMVKRFLEFGASDQWGKSRPLPVLPAIEVEAGLQSLTRLMAVDDQADGCELCAAVDIHGPGGGQWTLSRDAFGHWNMARGIDPAAKHLLQLNSADVCPSQSRDVSSHWFGKLFDVADSSPIPLNVPK